MSRGIDLSREPWALACSSNEHRDEPDIGGCGCDTGHIDELEERPAVRLYRAYR
jgi:hypothetical protein